MKTVLTIAGSDSSGGAGIQADIKTITMHGLYATSAITALTAQNTLGVTAILECTPEVLKEQLDCIFTDIYPDAVKIGMVANSRLIEVIAERLLHYQAKNIVLDPVMVATSGARLLSEEAQLTLREVLMPIAQVITPNIPEASLLSGEHITDKASMLTAAKKIAQDYSGAILLKGGHLIEDATDLLFANQQASWFVGQRILTDNTHGTGCTLSSAIACHLAKGESLANSIQQAKAFLSQALAYGLNLGQGSGPMNHMFALK